METPATFSEFRNAAMYRSSPNTNAKFEKWNRSCSTWSAVQVSTGSTGGIDSWMFANAILRTIRNGIRKKTASQR